MSETPVKSERNVHRQMFRGSMWAIAMRWADRIAGLISTVVLARLLSPADYGVVAIAMVIVGAAETFTRTGQYTAIIRHPNPTREHYDSAWTVSLLLGFGLGLVVLACAPVAALYFHEPRAIAVVTVLSFRTMLTGTQNVGVINFRRHLQFRKQFLFSLYPSLFSFIATMASAFVLRNYWALVIGIMSQYVCMVVLSYVMDPFRPHLSFAKVGEIWSFSIWTLVRTIAIYLNTQVDNLAIGGFAGAAGMGRYEIGRDVATSPTQELITPMVTTLLPVMAKVQGDHQKRRELYLSVLAWSAIICTSTSVGVALVTNDMVDLVLGPKWHDVKPFMPWLALAMAVGGITSSVYSAFETIGRPDFAARLQWSRLAILAACIFPVAFILRDLRAVAITRFIMAVVLAPALFTALARALDVRIRDFVLALWRPIASGLVMAALVLSINSALAFTGPLRLGLDVVVGSAGYAAALIALWHLSGRPEGPEKDTWTWLHETHRRTRLLILVAAGSARPESEV